MFVDPSTSQNFPHMFGQQAFPGDQREHPGVPFYTSTAPLGLNLRLDAPAHRMTITGAPSGIAPLHASNPVVTRKSPDAFVAATRASYLDNNRQVIYWQMLQI